MDSTMQFQNQIPFSTATIEDARSILNYHDICERAAREIYTTSELSWRRNAHRYSCVLDAEEDVNVFHAIETLPDYIYTWTVTRHMHPRAFSTDPRQVRITDSITVVMLPEYYALSDVLDQYRFIPSYMTGTHMMRFLRWPSDMPEWVRTHSAAPIPEEYTVPMQGIISWHRDGSALSLLEGLDTALFVSDSNPVSGVREEFWRCFLLQKQTNPVTVLYSVYAEYENREPAKMVRDAMRLFVRVYPTSSMYEDALRMFVPRPSDLFTAQEWEQMEEQAIPF